MTALPERLRWTVVATVVFGVTAPIPYVFIAVQSGSVPTSMENVMGALIVSSLTTSALLGGFLWYFLFEGELPDSFRVYAVGLGVVVGTLSPGMSLFITALVDSSQSIFSNPVGTLVAGVFVGVMGFFLVGWLTVPTGMLAGYVLARIRPRPTN